MKRKHQTIEVAPVKVDLEKIDEEISKVMKLHKNEESSLGKIIDILKIYPYAFPKTMEEVGVKLKEQPSKKIPLCELI
jgi:hypothetical protein